MKGVDKFSFNNLDLTPIIKGLIPIQFSVPFLWGASVSYQINLKDDGESRLYAELRKNIRKGSAELTWGLSGDMFDTHYFRGSRRSRFKNHSMLAKLVSIEETHVWEDYIFGKMEFRPA